MKKKISALLRIAVSFGLLGFLVWIMKDDVGSIWKIIAGGKLWFIAAGLVTILTNVMILSYRCKLIFQGENLNVGFLKMLQLTLNTKKKLAGPLKTLLKQILFLC